jgi:hypothetical protein
VKQELRLLLEAGVPDLWIRPLEAWMIGYMKAYDLSTGNLHDDNHIKDLNLSFLLHHVKKLNLLVGSIDI